MFPSMHSDKRKAQKDTDSFVAYQQSETLQQKVTTKHHTWASRSL